MSDCDHMCTKCDRKPCIELKPKMAVPRELQTDYEMMVTANLLMAVSIESLERKNDQLRELLQRLLMEYRYMRVRPRRVYIEHEGRMRAIENELRNLGVEVDG